MHGRISFTGISVIVALVLLVTGLGVALAMGMISLPQATTFERLDEVSRDITPFAAGTGAVVHPTSTRTVHERPGGPPVAELPSLQLGNPTWVPVVETAPGWLKVLLPSRPNRATGWISGTGGGLQVARTSHLIKVERAARRLTILRSGRVVGRWSVAVGAPATPTPLGRTFLLALLSKNDQTPGSVVLPTGTHSRTLDDYGGGPGTVAFHGWPDKTVFGKAVSHGCVRVPDSALSALSEAPLGTVVIIKR
jgi:lipoprotein-anchoring transpeptidase ErfK/SrfK